MSAKTGNTPKRKTPKSNKKIKQDKETIKKQDQKEKTNQSSSKSDSDQIKNQKNNQIDHTDEETNVQDETTTQSFAERLKILNLQSDVSDRLGGSNHSESSLEDDKEEEETRKMLKQVKTINQGSTNQSNSINGIHPIIPIASVGSFAQTLTQALKSTDTKLLESCFLQYESKKNKNLIANTIQRLPKSLLHNLIQQLIICLNRKKRGMGDGLTVAPVKRTRALIEWVQQIVIVHMSYLLTIPSLVTQLTALHGSLQKRLNLHTKLLSLNGRLDLVLNQIELKKINKERSSQKANLGFQSMNGINPKQTKSSSVSKNKPFQYVEGQSSDSEAPEENELAKSKGGDHSGHSNSSDDDNAEEEEEDKEEENDDDDDDDTTDDQNENGDDDRANFSDEGSIEEVVLDGSGSSDENSEKSDQEDENEEKLDNKLDDLLDLEAEESFSEMGEHDDSDEDEDSDSDEEEDSMDGFIDDASLESDSE